MKTWPDYFDTFDRRPPLPAAWREGFQASVTGPLLPDEVARLATDGVADPSQWTCPPGPLPPSYLDFLGWSNGGSFFAGDREWLMLAAEEVREYMLDYALPVHLPRTVPFALDGRGGFYLFDMRGGPGADGEYKVIHVPGDDLVFAAATEVADTFRGALEGRTAPGERGESAPDR